MLVWALYFLISEPSFSKCFFFQSFFISLWLEFDLTSSCLTSLSFCKLSMCICLATSLFSSFDRLSKNSILWVIINSLILTFPDFLGSSGPSPSLALYYEPLHFPLFAVSTHHYLWSQSLLIYVFYSILDLNSPRWRVQVSILILMRIMLPSIITG